MYIEPPSGSEWPAIEQGNGVDKAHIKALKIAFEIVKVVMSLLEEITLHCFLVVLFGPTSPNRDSGLTYLKVLIL